MLPFRVLVTRPLAAPVETDVTVSAAELLAHLGSETDPRRRDEAWRWPLPPSRTRVVEEIPAREVAHLAAAASRTLRTAAAEGVAGRAVGERIVRDALLDHVPIVVTTDDGRTGRGAPAGRTGRRSDGLSGPGDAFRRLDHEHAW